jgi:hypothetical protein
MFAMRGAEQLIEYPGLLNLPSQNPLFIKAFFLITVVAGVIAMSLIALGKFPITSP